MTVTLRAFGFVSRVTKKIHNYVQSVSVSKYNSLTLVTRHRVQKLTPCNIRLYIASTVPQRQGKWAIRAKRGISHRKSTSFTRTTIGL